LIHQLISPLFMAYKTLADFINPSTSGIGHNLPLSIYRLPTHLTVFRTIQNISDAPKDFSVRLQLFFTPL